MAECDITSALNSMDKTINTRVYKVTRCLKKDIFCYISSPKKTIELVGENGVQSLHICGRTSQSIDKLL